MEKSYKDSICDKIFKHSPDMLCAIDKDGRFVEVSGACKQILGYEPFELTGKPYIDFVVPEDREITLQTAHNIMHGYSSIGFENRYERKCGKAAIVMWSAAWSEEDGLFLCVARDVSERKQLEDKADESEQRYRAMFESHPDVIYYESRTGKITQVNDAFYKEFSYRGDEIIGKPASIFLPPEMAFVNKMSLQQALLGSTMRFDLGLSVEGQGERVFDTVKFPVTVNQEVVGAQTIARDITPIVRSYQLIEQQAKKLNDVLESITDAFFALDNDWRFTYVNSVFANQQGYKRRELVGKSLLELFPKTTRTLFYRKCMESFKNGKPCRFEESYSSSGVTYRYKVHPSAEGLSVYFSDVTKEKKMQQELEKLSLVASKTDNGVVITDAHGVTEWVNGGFTKITGYTLSELAGKELGAVLCGPETDPVTLDIMCESLRRGIPFNAELINYRKSGEKFWASVGITPIYGCNGKITQYIAIQRDINFRKEADANLVKMAEDLYAHNKDLQQFTYIVSHNLRAPVASALGLACLLTTTDKASETFNVSLAHLKTSLVRMDAVLKDVNTILSIRDRQGVLEKEQMRLVDVAKQSLSHLQEPLQAHGAEVIIDCDEGLTVNANRAYLYSIFYNLLTNAIKYRSTARQLKVKVLSFSDSNGDTVISVSDNGTGFDVEKAGDDIFKLYKRFHKETKGRGIGLFLVRTHVEAMGGRIAVSSQVNVGTEFQIHLPKD